MNQETTGKGLFSASGFGKSVKIYLPATIIYRGISFGRGLILAWLLSREKGQFGLLIVALQTINILAPLASLGLNEATTRYVPAYLAKGKIYPFVLLTGKVTLGIAFLATLVLVLFSQPLGEAIFAGSAVEGVNVVLLARVSFWAIFALIAYFWVASILKGLRMFPALSYMEVVHGVLFLVLAIAAILGVAPLAVHVIWTYIVALVVPTIIWGWILRKRLVSEAEVESKLPAGPLTRKLVRFGMWAAISGVVWQSWQIYSLWHLTKFDTALNSDTFAAGRLLGQLVLILGVALTGVVMTNVCTIWEQGDRKQANFLFDLYSKGVLMILLAAAVALVSLRGPLARLFPGQLAEISIILPQLFLYFQFLTILSFLAIQFVVIEKMRLMLWGWMTGLTVNVLLAFAWIHPPDALTGAANAAVWSCIPALLVMLILIRSQGQPVSIGMLIIIAASLILLAPTWMAILILAILAAWATAGRKIFDESQRAVIAGWLTRRSP